MSDVDSEQPATDRSTSASTFSVGGLCEAISDHVSGGFPEEIWVHGAISGLTRSANGHVYFDLVDPTAESGAATSAVLPVALFSSSKQIVNRVLRRSGGMRMHDGIEIRIRGRVSYYPRQGRIQLVMSLIDPNFTLGQMANARQELLQSLADEGLIEQNRQLDLPALPLDIGLVTSDQSAAYFDFVNELTSGGHPFKIVLHDTRVQGLEAVPGLSAAIEQAGRVSDVVVVVRGGGSRTDLVAFDHEDVARAIAACPVPVVVGVGHDVDRSVADELAYHSLKTPTAAAQFLVAAVHNYSIRVRSAADRLEHLASWHVAHAHHQLVGNGSRLAVASRRRLAQSKLEVDFAAERLTRSPAHALRQAESGLRLHQTRLAALDPTQALARGWSITYRVDGDNRTLLRRPDDVAPGDILETVTSSGSVRSTVVETSGAAKASAETHNN